MKKKIAFYISNHGFGHASRNIPIIEGLLEACPDIRIVIKTGSKQLEFIKQSLSQYGSKIVYYEDNVDLGLILKQGSYLIDKNKLKNSLLDFISTWDECGKKEKAFLLKEEISIVVSDIVPWIFRPSKEIGIKTILISNFLWSEIYQEIFEKNIYEIYKDNYRFSDYAYIYPLSGGIEEFFDKKIRVGLSCRKFDNVKVEKIRSEHNRPIVFMSLGRSVDISDEIDLSGLPYDFIYTDGLKLKGENTFKLPIETNNTHDYIKAAKFIITKSGWSTVSEAICARKPMLILNRNQISEDRNTINQVLNLKIGEKIEFDELNRDKILFSIEKLKVLEKNYDFIEERFKNCSQEIADMILQH